MIERTCGAVLVTLAERKIRFSILALAKDKSANDVKVVFIEALHSHASHVHTITYDNAKSSRTVAR